MVSFDDINKKNRSCYFNFSNKGHMNKVSGFLDDTRMQCTVDLVDLTKKSDSKSCDERVR